METPDKQSFGNIIDNIKKGEYAIPDFQRDFEWQASDVAELLKSIFKDFYIGTLLLWKADRKNIEDLSCEPIYGFPKAKLKPEHIVLDGQQRLSAIHYALFAPEAHYPKKSRRCLFFINIPALLIGNFDEAIYYEWDYKKAVDLSKDLELQFRLKVLPMKILSRDDYDYRDWIEDYIKYWKKNDSETVDRESQGLKDLIKDLLQTYEMSYIELDREIEIAKVCDIFTKINSTGVNLSIFDLMNAILKPKKIQLKEMWSRAPEDFNGIVEAKNILATMSILKQGYCAPSFLYFLVPGSEKVVKTEEGEKKKIVLIKNENEFINLWDEVIQNLSKTLNALRNPRDFGAITPNFLPYPTMIPILTALYMEKPKDQYSDKHSIEKKLKQWYWSSVFAKTYSSSAESQMARDYQEVKKWFLDDEALPQSVVQSNIEVGSLNLINETTQSSAIYKAIFNILIMKGANDFVNSDKPEYSNLHDHHIVPNSWGKRRIGKQINSILNRTPLSDVTNRDVIGDQLPNVYLKRLFDEAKDRDNIYKVLESHLINKKAVDILLREKFTADDYYEFIAEREKSMLQEIRKSIGNISLLEENLESNPNQALNDLEKSIRDFLDLHLRAKFGNIYWKDAIPEHIKQMISTNIQRDISRNPSMLDINDPRKRLDYCDMSSYYPIIKNNWTIFEKYFKNNQNTEKHFSQVSDFRNPEKHLRDKTEVTKKLGEASIGWFFEIINPDYIKNFKNVKRKKDIVNVPGVENLLSEEDFDQIDTYKTWLEEKYGIDLLDRFKDKKVSGEHKNKGRYDESWCDLMPSNNFLPALTFYKSSYYTNRPEVFICLRADKDKYKDVVEEIYNMPEMFGWLYKKEWKKNIITVPISLDKKGQVGKELQNAYNARLKIQNKYLINEVDDILYCRTEGVEARGKYLPGRELKVFKRSSSRISEVESFNGTSGQRLRKELVKIGILKEEEGVYVFTEDYVFSSPTAASEVVLGRSSNGRKDWVDKDGDTLDSIKNNLK